MKTSRRVSPGASSTSIWCDPTGDQPEAIKELVAGIEGSLKHQTLLGATGTGKTYTIAALYLRIMAEYIGSYALGGDVTGLLPYSRMKRVPGASVANQPSEVLVVHSRLFPEMIRAYLNIFKVRMEDRLNFSIDLPEQLTNIAFPPMLLQPLVENAIKHGLEPKLEGGDILIKVEEQNGMRRPAESLAKTSQVLVGDRGAHLIGHIDPGQTVGPHNLALIAGLSGIAVGRTLKDQMITKISSRKGGQH